MEITKGAIGAAFFNVTAIPATWGAFQYGQGLPAGALLVLIAGLVFITWDCLERGDKGGFLHLFGLACNVAIFWKLYL